MTAGDRSSAVDVHQLRTEDASAEDGEVAALADEMRSFQMRSFRTEDASLEDGEVAALAADMRSFLILPR